MRMLPRCARGERRSHHCEDERDGVDVCKAESDGGGEQRIDKERVVRRRRGRRAQRGAVVGGIAAAAQAAAEHAREAAELDELLHWQPEANLRTHARYEERSASSQPAPLAHTRGSVLAWVPDAFPKTGEA
eukprot:4978878-Pleurochrysis_carterae.AAC.2